MTDGPDGVLPARMYWLKQIPASAEETPDLSDEPIGTGPYRFESRNQGVDIELVANEEYWGDGGRRSARSPTSSPTTPRPASPA